jgi:plastocyanin
MIATTTNQKPEGKIESSPLPKIAPKTSPNGNSMKTFSVPVILLTEIIALLLSCPKASAATVDVTVAPNGDHVFSPSSVTVHPGDTVRWTWASGMFHSSTSGTPGAPNGIWDSGVLSTYASFSQTFNTSGNFPYYCVVHGGCCNMVGMVTVVSGSPTPRPTATATPGGTPAPSDFNGDAFPDYLLLNTNSHATVIWYLHNNVRVASDHGPALPGGWNVAGVEDFNGDGFVDLVLSNPSTRATRIWYLRNNDRVGTAVGPTLPGGWSLVGVADFNRDGHPDFLLLNLNSLATVVWYMNNNVHTASDHGPDLPMGWDVAGIADFNGDGFPDLVLFNPSIGGTRIWYLRNNDRIGTAAGPTVPGGWILAGVADFNRNSDPDYLLFNSITRGTIIWYLNNNVRVGSAAGPTLPAGWAVVAP